MNSHSRVLVVGNNDSIDRNVTRLLRERGFVHVFSSSEECLNTTIQASVLDFFARQKPEYVFLSAARCGGIEANRTQPADFAYQNLASDTALMYAAHKFGVKKLLYIAGSCVYPKDAPQPIPESALMTSAMEQTSIAYSMARLAGIVLCQAFRQQYGLATLVVIPATVFGPGDPLDALEGHIMAAVMGTCMAAVTDHEPVITLRGSGEPRREFLYCDDFLDACLFLMENYDAAEVVNIGTGHEVSIRDLAVMIARVTGFRGEIRFDATKPDGAMRTLLDPSRITALGWRPKVALLDGIERMYRSYGPAQGGRSSLR